MATRRRKKKPRESQTRLVLVLGDTHFPFHDPQAFSLCLKIIRTLKPYGVIQIGDMWDLKALSRHMRSIGERFFAQEFKAALKAFQLLDSACKDVPLKAVTVGNHDEWMSKYIVNNCPELEGYAGLQSPFEVAGLRERGWDVVPYNKHLTIGDVNFRHDTMANGRNSLMTSVARFGGNVVYGHTHAGGVSYSGDILGKKNVAMNVGCLVDWEYAKYMPEYHQSNNWIHGIGSVEIEADGVAFCNFHPFIEARTRVLGKSFSL